MLALFNSIDSVTNTKIVLSILVTMGGLSAFLVKTFWVRSVAFTVLGLISVFIDIKASGMQDRENAARDQVVNETKTKTELLDLTAKALRADNERLATELEATKRRATLAKDVADQTQRAVQSRKITNSQYYAFQDIVRTAPRAKVEIVVCNGDRESQEFATMLFVMLSKAGFNLGTVDSAITPDSPPSYGMIVEYGSSSHFGFARAFEKIGLSTYSQQITDLPQDLVRISVWPKTSE